MLTADRLRELVEYDSSTGIFTWRVGRPACRSGAIAGCQRTQDGSRKIGIDGAAYLEHRLAWLWMTGSWPRDQIDHINRDRSDNRWSNLRGATNAENQWNKRMQENNKSGFKGVSADKRRGIWYAFICINGNRKNLGSYKTPQLAHAAYVLAAKNSFGEFARTS